MPGVKALRKLQLGRESTAGTAVAATTIWRGEGTIEDQLEVVFPPEDVGILPGTDRAYIPKLYAELQLEPTPATYEQLPHLFEMGIKTATASQDGAGSDYIYAYAFPTTSANTLKNYTIEGGDSQQEEEMEYCYAREIKLSGKAGEALMMSATLNGRQVAASTYTGSLSLPSVEEVLFSKGKIYIDAIGGTIGTTQKTQTLLAMELTIKTGWMPVWTADGNLYYTFIKSTQPEIVADLTFEHDSHSVQLKADMRATTARLVRLQFEGSSVATPGTTYSKKTLRLDMAAKVEKAAKLTEIDGNDVVAITLRSRYSSTAAQFATFTLVNELSALP